MGLLLALVEASGFNPSLIILDVNLPDMLGFDVARRLRASTQTRQIPIIHLQQYPIASGKSESLESGADRFLEHPNDLLELVKAVRQELRHAGRF